MTAKAAWKTARRNCNPCDQVTNGTLVVSIGLLRQLPDEPAPDPFTATFSTDPAACLRIELLAMSRFPLGPVRARERLCARPRSIKKCP